jgi:rare lipoprotein A
MGDPTRMGLCPRCSRSALSSAAAALSRSAGGRHAPHAVPDRPAELPDRALPVNGVWYRPKVDYSYDETGTASWYGPGFDGKATADGEIYDMNQMTAAHKTLRCRAWSRSATCKNGRAIRLRVNDRGPFVGDRLIDVSRRAAHARVYRSPVRVMREKVSIARRRCAAVWRSAAGTAVAGRMPPDRNRCRWPPPLHRQAADIAAPLPPLPAPMRHPRRCRPPHHCRHRRPRRPRPRRRRACRRRWPTLIVGALRAPAGSQPRSGRMFVQARTIAVPENAQRVRAKIAALAVPKSFRPAATGLRLYRVRVGPVANEAEARRCSVRVVDQGYRSPRDRQ